MPRGWSGTFLRHFSCFDLFFVHHHGTNMAPSRFVPKSMKTFEFKFRQMSGKGRALAGRWAAKEAVIKALSSLQEEGAVNLWVDASAPLKDIEVIRTTGGEWVGVVVVGGDW